MDNTKKLEIGGKVYTFTARRSLIKTLYEISPSILQLNQQDQNTGADNASGMEFGLDLIAKLDVLFYEMIKPAHNISKETSDKIFETCCEEYGEQEILSKLIEFAMSVFPQGDQNKKYKKIVW